MPTPSLGQQCGPSTCICSIAAGIMAGGTAADDWPSSAETEFSNGDSSDIESLYDVGPAQQSLRRPAPKLLPFVSYEDWVPGQSYEEQPPQWMQYNMQWKLRLNNRKAVEQTEQDLVVAPSEFWQEELSTKITNIVNAKKKPYEANATTITMSVSNDPSQDKITKYFEKLDIDWSVVERQLQGWSHLLRIGKRLKIYIQLDYVEAADTARATGRGATANQLADRSARIDAEQVATGRPDPWRHVYQLMRCTESSCSNEGQWCLVNRREKKHLKLLDHHMRSLVKYVQQGNTLETHDDVPDHIRAQLHADEQQRHKRKRGGSEPGGHASTIIQNYIPGYPCQDMSGSAPVLSSTASSRLIRLLPLGVPGLRDDVVGAYRDWECSKVRSEAQKQHYELAHDLTLERGFDLELVRQDGDAQYYIERGVLEGVARRWVQDIETFSEEYCT